MTFVGITDIAYELGQPVDVMDGWARHQDLDDDFLERMKRNNVVVFRTARGIQPKDLCLSAVDKVLGKTGRNLSGLGGAIHFHSLHSSAPDFGTGYRAALRDRGLPDSAFFFSVSHQRCIGFHLALKLAQARLNQYPETADILLFGGDIALDESQRNIDGLAIESDAASAAIVSRVKGCEVLSTEIRTEGTYYQHDMPFDPRRYQITAYRAVLKLIEKVLENGCIDAQDLDTVISHNGNLDMWSRILRNLGIPEERHFKENFADIGHTNCSDFPINLATFLDRSKLKTERYVLVLSIAYGRSFGCTLLRTRFSN